MKNEVDHSILVYDLDTLEMVQEVKTNSLQNENQSPVATGIFNALALALFVYKLAVTYVPFFEAPITHIILAPIAVKQLANPNFRIKNERIVTSTNFMLLPSDETIVDNYVGTEETLYMYECENARVLGMHASNFVKPKTSLYIVKIKDEDKTYRAYICRRPPTLTRSTNTIFPTQTLEYKDDDEYRNVFDYGYLMNDSLFQLGNETGHNFAELVHFKIRAEYHREATMFLRPKEHHSVFGVLRKIKLKKLKELEKKWENVERHLFPVYPVGSLLPERAFVYVATTELKDAFRMETLIRRAEWIVDDEVFACEPKNMQAHKYFVEVARRGLESYNEYDYSVPYKYLSDRVTPAELRVRKQ
jgi:hypothetical protein